MIGKRERQRGLGTWISPHRIEMLPRLREVLDRSRLFARANPVHPGTAAEVEALVAGGVQVLMLPMFRSPAEVERFVAAAGGRAEVVLLLETREAAERIEEIAGVEGVDEVHVGINDLALALGMHSRFEVYDSPLVERASRVVRAAGLRFGIGGIGRVGDGSLPLPSELLYPQYPRLGATAALISRTFTAGPAGTEPLRDGVSRARAEMRRWFEAGPETLDRAHRDFREAVAAMPGW